MDSNYKVFYKYLIFLPVFLFCTSSYSQEIKVDTITVTKTETIRIVTTRTVPKFILQVDGNYNSGALELSSHNGGFSKDDFIRGKNFGARNGFGFCITGKLPLHKKGYFWLDALSAFNRFQSNLVANNTSQGNTAYNVFTEGLGIDYNFTPAHKMKYYINGNVLFSFISGKATLISYDITNTSPTRTDLNIKAAFRMGYSVSVGLEYAPDKNVGLNLGLRFSHLNLLLKNSKSPADTSNIYISDDSSQPPVIYGGWKQFAFASFYAGVSIYFDVKERRYKLP
jgi:opacity protein-like surface antigen